jgi:hypothetical protein
MKVVENTYYNLLHSETRLIDLRSSFTWSRKEGKPHNIALNYNQGRSQVSANLRLLIFHSLLQNTFIVSAGKVSFVSARQVVTICTI